MIGESYDTLPTHAHTIFWFQSIGEQGFIQKAVLYQHMSNQKYNLAFGDVTSSALDDKVISNNLDYVKVMNTVAKTVYEFTEIYPRAAIHIEAVDLKRLKFYNTIFRRHFETIQKDFPVVGLLAAERIFENYDPEKSYLQFELSNGQKITSLFFRRLRRRKKREVHGTGQPSAGRYRELIFLPFLKRK